MIHAVNSIENNNRMKQLGSIRGDCTLHEAILPESKFVAVQAPDRPDRRAEYKGRLDCVSFGFRIVR